MNHWLLKSEPAAFSIDDLAASARQRTAWEGVRNYQARNMLRDSIKKGDQAFFYHSSCAVPAVVGIVNVVTSGYPDDTAFDATHDYYDSESDRAEPRWYAIDVALIRKLRRPITLDELRKHASRHLEEFALLKRGNRLSVMPVTKANWNFILALE